ncbi:MAG TPA: TolC family protein [Caulobacteraceae bacterium]|nr:TolC family protein [Caulobacteraceae bacterium]
MKRSSHAAVLPFAALLLVGCAHAPFQPQAGATPVPPAFARAEPVAAAVQPDAGWWRALNDPTLDALVDRALTVNRDILAAEAELERARSLAKVERWSLLPTGGVGAGYARDRIAEGGTVLETDSWSAGADVSWEADLFGRLRANARAAEADSSAVAEAARGVRLAIAAETASTYLSLRGAQARLAAAETNARSQADTLKLTEALEAAGRANRLDVARAREQLSTTRSAIAGLEAEIAADLDALDVLTAATPEALKAALLVPADLPPPPVAYGVGDPEALLQRRPDIRRAEARLRAATARVRSAQVDWWPRLTFTGTAGWLASSLGDLGDSGGFSYSIGPRIDWPALDFRRNQLRLEAARWGAEAEFLRYDQAVLSGVREVDTAIAALSASSRVVADLEDAVRAAREAAELSRVRWREGIDPFLTVLDAERRLADAEDRLAVARTRQGLAYVQLGRSLGVGWSAA